MFWLAILGFAAAAVWIVARIRRKVVERERAAQARAADLLASLAGSAAPAAAPAAPAAASAPAAFSMPTAPQPRPPRAAATDGLAQQKLLFESAHKAGEAGEAALAIQLYARLLERYPATAFAQPARDAVEAQKKRLSREQ